MSHQDCTAATRDFFSRGDGQTASTDASKLDACAKGTTLVECCVKGFSERVHACVRDATPQMSCAHPGMRGRSGGTRVERR